jgi:hypothetical protein
MQQGGVDDGQCRPLGSQRLQLLREPLPDPRMGDAVKEFSFAPRLGAIPKDSRSNLATDDLAVGSDNRLAPPLAEGRNHLWLGEDLVTHLIGIQNGCPSPGKCLGNRAFAAGHAADNA